MLEIVLGMLHHIKKLIGDEMLINGLETQKLNDMRHEALLEYEQLYNLLVDDTIQDTDMLLLLWKLNQIILLLGGAAMKSLS